MTLLINEEDVKRVVPSDYAAADSVFEIAIAAKTYELARAADIGREIDF